MNFKFILQLSEFLNIFKALHKIHCSQLVLNPQRREKGLVTKCGNGRTSQDLIFKGCL